MKSVKNSVRVLSGLLLGGFILAAAGCQSNDTVLNADAPPPPKDKVLESDLRAYCPPIVLREGTAFFRTYAKGGQDDPAKLVYQASISDVTRSCTRSGDTMTINAAAAGRVIMGPVGSPGTISMPIRVAVVRGDSVLYSQLHKYQVQVGQGAGATQFVFNDPNVVIPMPEPGTIQVFIGYDEGPPKKK